jgi:hypothetical protein
MQYAAVPDIEGIGAPRFPAVDDPVLPGYGDVANGIL